MLIYLAPLNTRGLTRDSFKNTEGNLPENTMLKATGTLLNRYQSTSACIIQERNT